MLSHPIITHNMTLHLYADTTDLLDAKIKAREAGIRHSTSWDHERREQFVRIEVAPTHAGELGLTADEVRECAARADAWRERAMGQSPSAGNPSSHSLTISASLTS